MSALLLNNVSSRTFVLDANCKVTHWNSACESLTNAPAQEVPGRDEAWRAFYPYDTRRVVLAEMIVRRASPEEIARLAR